MSEQIDDRDRVFWLDVKESPSLRDAGFQCSASRACRYSVRYMELRFRRVGKPALWLTYAARCEYHYKADRRAERKAAKAAKK